MFVEPLKLPGGYYLEEEPDILILRKPNGMVLAYFSAAQWYTPEVLVRIIGMILKDSDRHAQS